MNALSFLLAVHSKEPSGSRGKLSSGPSRVSLFIFGEVTGGGHFNTALHFSGFLTFHYHPQRKGIRPSHGLTQWTKLMDYFQRTEATALLLQGPVSG